MYILPINISNNRNQNGLHDVISRGTNWKKSAKIPLNMTK